MSDRVISAIRGNWQQIIAAFCIVWWASGLTQDVKRIAVDVASIKYSQTESLKKAVELELRVVRLEERCFGGAR